MALWNSTHSDCHGWKVPDCCDDFSDEGHFQSITLIGRKYLHYNGMKRPPLQWLDHCTKISSTMGIMYPSCGILSRNGVVLICSRKRLKILSQNNWHSKTWYHIWAKTFNIKKAVPKTSLKMNRRKYLIGLSLWPVSSRGWNPVVVCRGT